MRRPMLAIALILLASLLVAAPASAAKPANSCPSAASGFVRVDRDGWWAATVAGVEEEGIDVYENDGVTFTAAFDAFAVDFGFADGAGLKEFVLVTNWPNIDRNGNGFTCKQEYPSTANGSFTGLAYFFNAVDDQSSSAH